MSETFFKRLFKLVICALAAIILFILFSATLAPASFQMRICGLNPDKAIVQNDYGSGIMAATRDGDVISFFVLKREPLFNLSFLPDRYAVDSYVTLDLASNTATDHQVSDGTEYTRTADGLTLSRLYLEDPLSSNLHTMTMGYGLELPADSMVLFEEQPEGGSVFIATSVD